MMIFYYILSLLFLGTGFFLAARYTKEGWHYAFIVVCILAYGLLKSLSAKQEIYDKLGEGTHYIAPIYTIEDGDTTNVSYTIRSYEED